MKKPDNGNPIPPRSDFIKLNFLQICYVICAGTCYILSGVSFENLFGKLVSEPVILVICVITFIFTIILFVYNHKHEKHAANKQTCYLFTLLALVGGLVHYIPIWFGD